MVAIVIALYSQRITLAEVKTRVVHFPKDRSMGILYLLDTSQSDTSESSDWERFREATGDVAVPAGKVLRLDLNKEAGYDLSPLLELRPDDLVVLRCFGVVMADEQLQHISDLTGLQEINLSGTGILGTGLKHLAKLKSLERLVLNNTRVGDNELAHLTNLPSLKWLCLFGTRTTDAGMVHVGKITSLEVLLLSWLVGDEGLSHLTSLLHLTVRDESISNEGLSHLAGMRRLESLYLQKTQINDEGLIHLRQMKRLKELLLSGTRVTQKGLVHLKDLRNLEYLDVSFDIDAGLEYLSKLPSLKKIRIDAGSITVKELEILSKMKSLEEIFVNCSRNDWGDNTSEVLTELAKSLDLKSLHICKGVTDEVLMSLTDMQSLQELDIYDSGVQITGEGIAALAEIPSLRKLTIMDMELPSELQWEALGKLSSLEYLELESIRSRITDVHIALLSDLRHLKYLYISSSYVMHTGGNGSLDITEKALIYISNLKALEHLNLSGVIFTDAELQHLAELPALKLIIFYYSDVSQEGLRRLQEKLPALSYSIR
jgi:Leucine-rich repeat (LRR) protein